MEGLVGHCKAFSSFSECVMKSERFLDEEGHSVTWLQQDHPNSCVMNRL